MERFPGSIVLGDRPFYKGYPVQTQGRQITGDTREQLLTDYPRLGDGLIPLGSSGVPLQVGHLYLHLCPECQQWFIAHHAKRYCSARCSHAPAKAMKLEAQRKRRAKRREWRDDLPQSCEHCGHALQAQRLSRRFCSDRCRKAAGRTQPRPPAAESRTGGKV